VKNYTDSAKIIAMVYGNGITVSEIELLSTDNYSERRAGYIAFDDARGPHTLDIWRNTAVFDFYFDGFSFFAGCRRIAVRYRRIATKYFS
jgi:hypothetical protein